MTHHPTSGADERDQIRGYGSQQNQDKRLQLTQKNRADERCRHGWIAGKPLIKHSMNFPRPPVNWKNYCKYSKREPSSGQLSRRPSTLGRLLFSFLAELINGVDDGWGETLVSRGFLYVADPDQ
ncbi:hypothetical protein IWX65_003550 [Arthrobacter sp. CAN_A214]